MYYLKNLGNLFLRIRVTTRNWMYNFQNGKKQKKESSTHNWQEKVRKKAGRQAYK